MTAALFESGCPAMTAPSPNDLPARVERSTMTESDRKRIAKAVGGAMWEQDQASRNLGMRLKEIGPGHARIEMAVLPEMANGLGICHGGKIFSLADTAFASACNSHNRIAVASACHIDFLAPAQTGDILEAEAIERAAGGRTGVYDVVVRCPGRQVTIALFRGKSHRLNGDVVPGLR